MQIIHLPSSLQAKKLADFTMNICFLAELEDVSSVCLKSFHGIAKVQSESGWLLSYCWIRRPVLQPILNTSTAQGWELDGLQGTFQLKPFYNTMIFLKSKE